MGLLAWMVLVVLLSSAPRLSAVDVNVLTRVVEDIRTEYRINRQFCLAANIPLTDTKTKLKELLENNKFDPVVSDTLDGGDVYTNDNIIIAEHKDENPVHAERQVLTNLQRLRRNKDGNFLLVYSYLSPCEKCTNSIYSYMKSQNIRAWPDSAFVFTTVYDRPRDGSVVKKEELVKYLCKLGEAMGDLSKVYRCYKPTNEAFQCHSCSMKGEVSEVCVDNSAIPGLGGSSYRCPDESVSRKRKKSWSPDQSTSRRSRYNG